MSITPTPVCSISKLIYFSMNSEDSLGLVSNTTFRISVPIFAQNLLTQNEFIIEREYKIKVVIIFHQILILYGRIVNNKQIRYRSKIHEKKLNRCIL
jgi:hypothetical protein